MTDLVRRALAIGLRTLADEIDQGALDVEQVLGAVAPPPAAPNAEPPAAAGPKRPRPQRRERPSKPKARPKRKRARPRPAAEEPDELELPEVPEARQLIDQLSQACGSLSAVSERFGLANAGLLGRWRTGNVPCSQSNLERLRAAVGELGRLPRPEAFRS